MDSENLLPGATSGRGLPTQGTDFLRHAHHFVMKNTTMVSNHYGNENALGRLALHTIPGAEFDSSARDPPPQCHPNTRSTILQKFKDRLRSTDMSQRKILWLYGPAGVGKSAIIQTLAESASESSLAAGGFNLGATLFFSKPNNRDNPKLVFNTIAYQLAIQHPFYKDFILRELAADPKLVEKATAEQFRRLIIKPFGQLTIYGGSEPLCILVDGLDECKGEREQCEIVILISRFVARYPTVPVVWVIASRPEPHLCKVFSRKTVEPNCRKEEVPVNSDDGIKDVERYLREELQDIEEEYSELFPVGCQWPMESQLLTLAAAALGLFAFASTVIRFIRDTERGNPVSQMEEVLAVINKTNVSRKSNGRPANPLATLDALYTRILSAIPEDILPTTKRILAQHSANYQLSYLSNMLELKQHDFYGALQKLHSVLGVPRPEVAHSCLTSYHASFYEYLNDDERSGAYSVSLQEGYNEQLRFTVRILLQASSSGSLASNISLSWPPPHPDEFRLELLDNRLLCLPGVFKCASGDVQQEELHRITQALGNLDFGNLHSTMWNLPSIIMTIQDFLRPLGVHHKIVRTVPISAVRVEWINVEKVSHVYCDQYRDHWTHRTGFDLWGSVPLYAEDRGDCLGRHAMGPLNSESMAQVLHDLEYLKSHLPNTEATIFGVESKGVVAFKRELSLDEEWFYILPYNNCD